MNLNNDDHFKLKKRLSTLNLMISLTIIGLGLAGIIGYTFLKQELSKDALAYGFISLFLVTAFLEFIPQMIHPYFAFVAAISSGLNMPMAFAFSLAGSIIGSVIGFEVGKKQGIDFVCLLLSNKAILKVFKFWYRFGYLFVFLAALTPLPYFPILFGALQMSRKDFYKFGVIPRSLGFAALAAASYFGFSLL